MRYADATILVMFRKFANIMQSKEFSDWIGPITTQAVRVLPDQETGIWRPVFGDNYMGQPAMLVGVKDEQTLMLLKLTYNEHILEVIYVDRMRDYIQAYTRKIFNAMDQKILESHKSRDSNA